MLSICVLNKSCGHWLLSNALHITITMTLKFKEEFEIATYLDNMMENDFNVTLELWIFACNIRKETFGIFFSFLRKYEKRKPINVISNVKPKI